MRTVSASTEAAITSNGTEPRYLVRLGYSPVIYLSSRETVTWDGQSWTGAAGGVAVDSISQSSGGGQTASIRLPNHDAAYAALVLGSGIREITADIYMLYGDAPFAADDGEHIFSGQIDSVPTIDDWVVMQLRSSGASVSSTPRIRLAAFIGDDMPVPGTRIQWAGDVLILEEQS